MSFVIVAGVTAVAAGATKAIMGGIAAKKARKAKEKEQAELESYKAQYAGLDTSNPFQNMQIMMEVLTVDQRASEFQKEQQQQSQANILDQMRGAAGASGVAGLAQAMARQGSLDAQQAAADIGKQEQANQMARQQEAARIQQMERQGDVMSREAEASKVQTLMGMSAADVQAEAQNEMLAQQAMMSGFGDIAGGAMGIAGGVGGDPTGGGKAGTKVVK